MPITPELSTLILQALIAYGPSVARAIAEVIQKKDVSLEDWMTIFAMAEKSYDDYVAPAAPVEPKPPAV